jgi:hypothetical protein
LHLLVIVGHDFGHGYVYCLFLPLVSFFLSFLQEYGYSNLKLLEVATEEDLLEAFTDIKVKRPHQKLILKAWREGSVGGSTDEAASEWGQDASENPAKDKSQRKTNRRADGGADHYWNADQSKGADTSQFKDCESCREAGNAWCISTDKCVEDLQARCDGPNDHIGKLGKISTCAEALNKRQKKGAQPKKVGKAANMLLYKRWTQYLTCDSCRQAGGAWCISISKCADDINNPQGPCKGNDDHVGLKGKHQVSQRLQALRKCRV